MHKAKPSLFRESKNTYLKDNRLNQQDIIKTLGLVFLSAYMPFIAACGIAPANPDFEIFVGQNPSTEGPWGVDEEQL